MPNSKLPVDLQLGDRVLTASTPAEFVDLTFRGFRPVEDEVELTPAEKAAKTRAENKARQEQETSNVPESAVNPAGDANPSN